MAAVSCLSTPHGKSPEKLEVVVPIKDETPGGSQDLSQKRLKNQEQESVYDFVQGRPSSYCVDSMKQIAYEQGQLSYKSWKRQEEDRKRHEEASLYGVTEELKQNIRLLQNIKEQRHVLQQELRQMSTPTKEMIMTLGQLTSSEREVYQHIQTLHYRILYINGYTITEKVLRIMLMYFVLFHVVLLSPLVDGVCFLLVCAIRAVLRLFTTRPETAQPSKKSQLAPISLRDLEAHFYPKCMIVLSVYVYPIPSYVNNILLHNMYGPNYYRLVVLYVAIIVIFTSLGTTLF